MDSSWRSQNWNDAPEIQKSKQIRVGDIIGTAQPYLLLRYTVKMIGGPQRSPTAVDILLP